MDNIYFTIANLVILGFTAFLSFRRAKFQNVVDDSQASVNFRNIVVSLQAVVKEQDVKIAELNDKLDRAHLEVVLSFKIGEKPDILSWKWIEKKEATPIPG